MDHSKFRQKLLPVILIGGMSALLFCSRLDSPLLEPQEPRYAEVPREMLQAHDWIVPKLHGEPYLDKPPLLYWSVMFSFTLFGVSDWAARLVPGAAGVLTVLVTWLWASRIMGRRSGFLAPLLLLLAPGFIYRERMLTFDCLLCLWTTAALAAGHLALRDEKLRWRLWLLSALCGGLGLLTKGPVVFALVIPPLFLLRWLSPMRARASILNWSIYVGIASAVALPWSIAIGLREPQFLSSFLWKHNIVRFVQPFDHEEPLWFYIPGLLGGMLPWIFLLPGLIGRLRGRDNSADELCAPRFCLLTAAWIVFFFSLAGCKRAVYILPAMPPLAMALGWYLNQLLPSGASWWVELRQPSRLASRIQIFSIVLATSVVIIAALKHFVGVISVAVLVTMLAIALAAALWQRSNWAICLLSIFIMEWLGVCFLQPAYNRQFALEHLKYESSNEIVCYPQNWDSVRFYLPSADVRVFRAEEVGQLSATLVNKPDTLLVIKPGRPLEEVRANLPAGWELAALDQAGIAWIGKACVNPSGAIAKATGAGDRP